MVHELRTWPEYFQSILTGAKAFEVRKDDRGFEEGDELVLMEYDPKACAYSGAHIRARVTYVLHGGSFGVEDGFVVMSIRTLSCYNKDVTDV